MAKTMAVPDGVGHQAQHALQAAVLHTVAISQPRTLFKQLPVPGMLLIKWAVGQTDPNLYPQNRSRIGTI